MSRQATPCGAEFFLFSEVPTSSLQGLVNCKESKKGGEGPIRFFVLHTAAFFIFSPCAWQCKGHMPEERAGRMPCAPYRTGSAVGIRVRRSLRRLCKCRSLPRTPSCGARCGFRAGVRSYPPRGPAPEAKTVQQPRALRRPPRAPALPGAP